MTPATCSYEYVGLRNLDDKISSFVKFDEKDGLFKIGGYYESLDVVGDYSFEIVYKAKNIAGETVVTSYSPTKLTVHDPCLNKSFVHIEHTDDLDSLAYTIGSGAVNYVHAPFKVVTQPVEHDLCGPLVQVGSFNGAPVDGEMVKYDSATNTFTIDTDAVREWKGEITEYGVTATLATYP